MFRKIHFLIICFMFGFIFLCVGNEVTTDGQRKLFEINKKIEERLNKGEQCNNHYLDENLLPLLKEVITRGQIWEDDKPVEGLPSFQSFLSSSIGNHSNPYFTYAWWRYIRSDRFKQGGTESRQKTCHVILKMLNDDLSRYSKFREYLFSILFMYCGNSKYFNEANSKLAQQIIMKHKDKASISLLFFLDRKDLDKETLDYVMEQAAFAPKIAKPDHHTGAPDDSVLMFLKNRIPFISLVFLAKDGDPKHLATLLSLLHKDGRFIDFRTADRLFPYLIFVKKHEVVLMLKEYLKDETIIDQGDDIMYRYTGYWQIAAFSLYMLLDGFPLVTSMNCEMSHNDINAERLKCLDWLEKHPSYQFRESIDWESSDDITRRMRRWIFDS